MWSVKKIISVVAALMVAGGAGASANGVKVCGTVKDAGSGNPVGYATVVALSPDSTVVAATVASEAGSYGLDIAPGSYIFNVNCIGYEPHGEPIDCREGEVEMDFNLRPSAIAVEEVSVRAARVRREADRYVISVAGSMDAIGKNAKEFLSTSPGVWIRNDQILVEGRGGAQVMVNDRILNMDEEQVLAYLRNIDADDITRIEIIPRAGADQDASTTGGIIKITLKKKRDDGVEITPSMRAQWAGNYTRYRPGVSVNYRIGSLATYANVYLDNDDHKIVLTEKNITEGTVLDSRSRNTMRDNSGGGRLGAIYDINDRQSVGMEYAAYVSNEIRPTRPLSTIYAPEPISSDSSYYRDDRRYREHYGAANYILKLDSLGSVFKVIGDISRTSSRADNRYFNRHTVLAGDYAGSYADTLYRSRTRDKYLVATGSASLEKVFADRGTLEAGVKFIYTSLDDDSRYWGDAAGVWQLHTGYSILQKYSEKIGAAYVSYNSTWGILSYDLGLRGEYTHALPETTLLDGSAPEKNKTTYFSLFPTVNLSVPFNADKGYSVAAFYNRKISRPGFWALNPIRMQVSEYSYIVGDPGLKPSYSDEVGLTFILAHKYSLTGSYTARKDVVNQFVTTDPQTPEVIVYRQMNIGSYDSYNLSAVLPFTITEKIDLNVNAYFSHSKMDPGNAGRKQLLNSVYTNANINFTLPRAYRLEVSGYYVSSQLFGNLRSGAMGDVNIGVRKRFFNDKVSASVQLNNVFDFSTVQKFTIRENNFVRKVTQKQAFTTRMAVVSIQYNFKSGHRANGREVERGGDDSR